MSRGKYIKDVSQLRYALDSEKQEDRFYEKLPGSLVFLELESLNSGR